MTCGIYLLNFIGTHKVYVGQSLHMEGRFREHLTLMKTNSHTKKLMEAYIAYGPPTLEVEEILPINSDMDNKENYYIALWNAVDGGFNTLYNTAGGTSSGEDNAKALYKDTEYVNIMMYLINNPGISLVKASKILEKSYSVVKQLANGRSHSWLSKIYPEEYSRLMDINGTRSIRGESHGAAVHTNAQLREALLLQFNNPNMQYQEIADIVGISESAVTALCTGKKYLWLADEHPMEYVAVLSNRDKKRAYSRSAAARGITYPPVVSPDGTEYYVENVNAFAKLHGLDTGSLNKVLNRKSLSTKGWRVKEDN